MAEHVAVVVGAGSQGRVHARAYQSLAGVELVAVADVLSSSAADMAEELDIPRWYQDHEELVLAERPDIVSVCTPPGSHLEVARFAIEHGARAVHCEKPMATTYGDARQLHNLAARAGAQLTFNLQRRYDPVHEFARHQIAAGAIGEVASIEGYCPNLPDWGSHICDLMLFYMDDVSPAWVMGQVDVKAKHYVYGALTETSSVTLLQWPSGVNGLIVTGREPFVERCSKLVRNGMVVNGTGGRLVASGSECEVAHFYGPGSVFKSPTNRDHRTWERGVDPAIVAGTSAAVHNLVECLEKGDEPRLSSRHALAGAEIIFATYESSRSRSRVDLPLAITDNPLVDGLSKGYWRPTDELHSTY